MFERVGRRHCAAAVSEHLAMAGAEGDRRVRFLRRGVRRTAHGAAPGQSLQGGPGGSNNHQFQVRDDFMSLKNIPPL